MLFIPTHTCQLLSISELMKFEVYMVSFVSSIRTIQDRFSMTLIRMGEFHNALYF